jgi:hypothetical protein
VRDGAGGQQRDRQLHGHENDVADDERDRFGRLAGADPATVLAGTGWARTVGSVNPYLTIAARSGTSRADVDAAVAALAIHELPAARGCMYLVPEADFGLALQVGRGVAEAQAIDRYTVGRAGAHDLLDVLADPPHALGSWSPVNSVP